MAYIVEYVTFKVQLSRKKRSYKKEEAIMASNGPLVLFIEEASRKEDKRATFASDITLLMTQKDSTDFPQHLAIIFFFIYKVKAHGRARTQNRTQWKVRLHKHCVN